MPREGHEENLASGNHEGAPAAPGEGEATKACTGRRRSRHFYKGLAPTEFPSGYLLLFTLASGFAADGDMASLSSLGVRGDAKRYSPRYSNKSLQLYSLPEPTHSPPYRA